MEMFKFKNVRYTNPLILKVYLTEANSIEMELNINNSAELRNLDKIIPVSRSVIIDSQLVTKTWIDHISKNKDHELFKTYKSTPKYQFLKTAGTDITINMIELVPTRFTYRMTYQFTDSEKLLVIHNWNGTRVNNQVEIQLEENNN